MGQKVNPHGFRVGVIKDWDSRWFAKDEVFGDTLINDYKVRKYLKETLNQAGVPKIEIERDNARARVFIHCAKPGMVIGRGGTEIEKLRHTLEEMIGKPVMVEVVEVKNPDLNAQLVAESIAAQLERRIAFRRAMKQSIQRTMRLGAKGIKIAVGGRLNGAEIARSETYHEGTIPLQTLRADIEYGFAEANTTYGKLGVKVWIYKGEVLQDTGRKQRFSEAKIEAPKQERRGDRRDRRDGDRRGGDRRDRRDGDRRGGRNDRNNGQQTPNYGGSGRVSNYNPNKNNQQQQNTAAPKEGGDA